MLAAKGKFTLRVGCCGFNLRVRARGIPARSTPADESEENCFESEDQIRQNTARDPGKNASHGIIPTRRTRRSQGENFRFSPSSQGNQKKTFYSPFSSQNSPAGV